MQAPKGNSRKPPTPKSGAGRGFRTMNGTIKDIRSLALKLGCSEKKVRSMVERRVIPFRKHGNRVVFLEHEIEEYFEKLPGVSVDESIHNLERRIGERAT